ncbi:MAG: hypothetical protein QM582_01875 [Micropruina sp.]|uniref:hypothetical protein n=1 Tax=Micropruina sp. TaxID=2737536 RepID=UPI0039E62431
MSRFVRRAFAITLGITLTLTGCTAPESRVSPPASTGLGNADVAVYITEWVNGRTPSGRVVLYDRNGPVSMVTHHGIEGNGLIWDNKGLFFIDQTDDFHITDTTMERRRRSRDAGTVLGMRGDGNGRRVVLFNDGLANGQNHTGVIVYNGINEESNHDLIDSTAFAIASCHNGFYLAGPTIEVVSTSELVRLDPPARQPPQRVGDAVPGEFVDDVMGSPCRDGKVIGLWHPFLNGPISSIPMEIWQWNTANGTIQRAPLKTPQGTFGLQLPTLASSMPRWLDGNDLLWVDATGIGRRTNLTTGITRKIRDGMIAYRGPIDHWTLAGDYLIGFEYSPNRDTAHLQIYSAHTMQLLETRNLPGLADVTPTGQQVLAIAVRPSYQPAR